MIVLVIILITVFMYFFLSLLIFWERIPTDTKVNRSIGVTVLIPVRNEEKTIARLLNAINNQCFPMYLLEVLVIDDHSEDNTLEEVNQVSKHVKYSLKTIKLQKDQYGKKIASTIGNQHAKFDLILCTDADTVPGEDWVSLMTGKLSEGQMKMVSGPVMMHGSSVLEQLQILEFSGLIGFGAISIYLDRPTMCNGANMAYHKQAFAHVGGYMNNLHIATGDDEFLLRKIEAEFPGQIGFVKTRQAIVSTSAKSTVQELWVQRIRWISKWNLHRSLRVYLLSIVSFSWFAGLGWFLVSLLIKEPLALLISWSVLFVSLVSFLRATNQFFGNKVSYWLYMLLLLIYPYYAVVLGIASIFGSYSWKGRQYSR